MPTNITTNMIFMDTDKRLGAPRLLKVTKVDGESITIQNVITKRTTHAQARRFNDRPNGYMNITNKMGRC